MEHSQAQVSSEVTSLVCFQQVSFFEITLTITATLRMLFLGQCHFAVLVVVALGLLHFVDLLLVSRHLFKLVIYCLYLVNLVLPYPWAFL